jgi:hypothetical protein
VGGCLPLDTLPGDKEPGSLTVPSSPFGPPPAAASPTHTVSYAPPTREVALRVDRLGRDILAANPQIGFKPLFATIGAPQPELFHQGTTLVHITEGLVTRCKSDSQLAALLCVELGKMVAERETMAAPFMRQPQHRPPAEVPIGNAGQFSAPDLIHQAELAPYDRERRDTVKRSTPPDPMVLAKGYLERAGFANTELEAVAPLLALADRNCVLEKQMSGAPALPGTSTWTPKK